MVKRIVIFTVDECAFILRVHPNTVRNAIKCGRIQAFRVGIGKRAAYRIFSTEIQRMAEFDATEMIENIVRKRIMDEHV